MRSDIINDVLTVEDRAQKIITDAEHTARDYISDAQIQANAHIRSRIKEEREKNHAKLQLAQEDALSQLEQYEASLNTSLTFEPEEMQDIVQTLVAQICATELDGLVK